jgi:hypothetical protein
MERSSSLGDRPRSPVHGQEQETRASWGRKGDQSIYGLVAKRPDKASPQTPKRKCMSILNMSDEYISFGYTEHAFWVPCLVPSMLTHRKCQVSIQLSCIVCMLFRCPFQCVIRCYTEHASKCKHEIAHFTSSLTTWLDRCPRVDWPARIWPTRYAHF